MTKDERALAQRLKSEKSGYFVNNYVAPNGIAYMRLRTEDHRPLCNIKKSVFRKLSERGLVDETEKPYMFDIEKLVQMYEDWKERKRKRDEQRKKKITGGQVRTQAKGKA